MSMEKSKYTTHIHAEIAIIYIIMKVELESVNSPRFDTYHHYYFNSLLFLILFNREKQQLLAFVIYTIFI